MIKDSIRAGKPYPDAVMNAPTLEMEAVFYFNAFQELSTTRRFEGGYIPWDAIHEYATVYGVPTPDLAHVVMNLDNQLMAELRNGKGKHANLGNAKPLDKQNSGRSRKAVRKLS